MNSLIKRQTVFCFLVISAFFFHDLTAISQGSTDFRKAHALISIHGNIRIGQNLSTEEVLKLEEQLESDSENSEIRTKLVGYYGDFRHWQDFPRREKYRAHVLWQIRNQPASELLGTPFFLLTPFKDREAYGEGKNAWLEQVKEHPEDINVLSNASQFFTLPDREIAIELMESAQKLESMNPDWPMKLGHLYELKMRGLGEIDLAAARKSVAAYERALELGKGGRSEATLLQSLAKTSFAAERFENAKTYATRLIENFATSGRAPTSIHYGNTILGRLAMREGNISKAKEHLLTSGRIGGSPTLSSFGPSMALAHDLLGEGQWDVVIEYFDLCSKFWNRPRSLKQLENWKALAKEKRVPEFGANLSR